MRLEELGVRRGRVRGIGGSEGEGNGSEGTKSSPLTLRASNKRKKCLSKYYLADTVTFAPDRLLISRITAPWELMNK